MIQPCVYVLVCVCIRVCVCACDSGFLYWCFGYAFYGPKLVHFIRRLLRFWLYTSYTMKQQDR